MSAPINALPPGRQVKCIFALSLVLSLAWTAAAKAQEADSAAATFKQYCLACHSSSSASGGLNLEALLAASSVGDEFQHWEKVAAVLEQERMPPQGLPAPSADARTQAASWVRGELRTYAEQHAGDPGDVTVRRLTSAEYAYTIRDLTGR